MVLLWFTWCEQKTRIVNVRNKGELGCLCGFFDVLGMLRWINQGITNLRKNIASFFFFFFLFLPSIKSCKLSRCMICFTSVDVCLCCCERTVFPHKAQVKKSIFMASPCKLGFGYSLIGYQRVNLASSVVSIPSFSMPS